MRTRHRRLVLLSALALLSPALALAQAQVRIHVDLPPVLPPLVVVQPGVQVVQDFDEEVFFVDGYYWIRRDGRWYRARDHRAAWVYVEPRHVPPGLVRIPPGRYRHWRKEERKEERKAWREHQKEERKAWKEREKEERHEAKEERKRGKRGED